MDLSRTLERGVSLRDYLGLDVTTPPRSYVYGYLGADHDNALLQMDVDTCKNSVFFGCVPYRLAQWFSEQMQEYEYEYHEDRNGDDHRTEKSAIGRVLFDLPYVNSGLLPHEYIAKFGCPERVFFVGDGIELVTMHVTDFSDFDEEAEAAQTNGSYVAFVNKSGITTALWSPTLNTLCIIMPFSISALGKEERELIKKKIQKMVNLVKVVESSRKFNRSKLLEGADVEFTVFDSDSWFHSATEFVADSLEGQIGTDGNVETLEIRPEQEKTPQQLTNNIEDLLRTLYRTLPKGYDLLGGGGKKLMRSTGLHIHFSGTSVDCGRGVKGDPREVVNWLDQLIYMPIQLLKGWKRQDNEHYGFCGDYRNRANHSGFPHDGFEWRALPTICINRELTESVLALAYMVLLTFEEKGKYSFPEHAFGANWYTGLVDADKYKKEIKYFVDFVNDKSNLEVPVLREWFGKEFEKDKECDVTVCFANDEAGYLAISPFVMFNPQKDYNRIVFWDRGPDKVAVSISSEVAHLEKYLMEEHGFKLTTASPSTATLAKYTEGKTLFIGIPQKFLYRLNSKSSGSRNRVKMFAQDIIKHI